MRKIDATRSLLREMAIWILDTIEYSAGLAVVGSPPQDAVRQLLGPAYAALKVRRRHASYGFSVVLDLSAIFGLEDLYADVLNDLEAIDAYATVVVPIAPNSARLVARAAYSPDISQPAAHHHPGVEAMVAAGNGEYFDCIATWATQRDRHMPSVLRALAGADQAT